MVFQNAYEIGGKALTLTETLALKTFKKRLLVQEKLEIKNGSQVTSIHHTFFSSSTPKWVLDEAVSDRLWLLF